MVEWCTQNLHRNGSISRGTSHATTTERYQYTTSADINNTRYKRMQTLIQNHMRHVRSESARERRIALNKSDQQHCITFYVTLVAASLYIIINSSSRERG